VLQGEPTTELPRVLREWHADTLAYELDTEPYALARDATVDRLARDAGVRVVTRWGHTLCDLDALLKRSGGTPTTTYSTFLNHMRAQLSAEPIAPLAAPSSLPPLGDGAMPPGACLVPSASALGVGAQAHIVASVA
jgi:cryptochrome